MFTCSAICDVPAETLLWVTSSLHAHRRQIGTRTGRRRNGTHPGQDSAALVSDDAANPHPGRRGSAISTAYRYLHEAIDVIAEEEGP